MSAGIEIRFFRCASAALASAALCAFAGPSLVEESAWMSDDRAARELARMLSHRPDLLPEAAREYERLLERFPRDQELLLEALVVYDRIGDQSRFDVLLGRLPQEDRGRPELLAIGMRRAAAAGRAAEAREQCRKLMGRGKLSDALWREIAGTVQIWGDFVLAENIAVARAAESSDSRGWALVLAGVWTGAQRFFGAEAVCRRLLEANPRDIEALTALSAAFESAKDFDAALETCERAAACAGETAPAELLEARARLLARAGRIESALGAWRDLAAMPGAKARGMLGEGRTLEKAGRHGEAARSFDAALEADPGNAAALFFLECLPPGSASGPEAFAARHALDAAGLLTAAGLASEYLNPAAASAFFRLALKSAPNHFQARRGLAQALAAQRDYAGALELLRELASEFPESYALGIELARALAWSRAYGESLERYAEMRGMNPGNPIALLESARVCGWAGMPDRSMEAYEFLYTPAVDESIALKFGALGPAHAAEDARRAVARMKREKKFSDAPFVEYEIWIENFGELSSAFSPADAGAAMRVLLDAREAYLGQKSAWLESRAKSALYNRRLREALVFQGELLAFQPGNEEILFDHSQCLLELGLERSAYSSYLRLLDISPLHTHAQMVVRRAEIQSHPGVIAGLEVWREKGRDGIADIGWWRVDLGAEAAVFMQNKIRAKALRWFFEADGMDNSAATGLALEADLQLGPRFMAAGAWTGRRAEYGAASDSDCFSAQAAWLGLETLKIEAGFEQRDVIQNRIGLSRGIQSKDLWAGLSAAPLRGASLSGGARRIDYSDDNSGAHLSAAAGYDITDHPQVLNLSAHGGYRDTDSVNEAAPLDGARHPYWTPEKYWDWAFMLAFYHDLSAVFAAGADRRGYNVKLSAGSDSENNPMVRVEVEARVEFALRTFVSLKATIHRSRDWDAEQAALSAGLRF